MTVNPYESSNVMTDGDGQTGVQHPARGKLVLCFLSIVLSIVALGQAAAGLIETVVEQIDRGAFPAYLEWSPVVSIVLTAPIPLLVYAMMRRSRWLTVTMIAMPIIAILCATCIMASVRAYHHR